MYGKSLKAFTLSAIQLRNNEENNTRLKSLEHITGSKRDNRNASSGSELIVVILASGTSNVQVSVWKRLRAVAAMSLQTRCYDILIK